MIQSAFILKIHNLNKEKNLLSIYKVSKKKIG